MLSLLPSQRASVRAKLTESLHLARDSEIARGRHERYLARDCEITGCGSHLTRDHDDSH